MAPMSGGKVPLLHCSLFDFDCVFVLAVFSVASSLVLFLSLPFNLFLLSLPSIVLHKTDLEAPEDPAAAKESIKYVDEWRALEYVQDLNKRLGVAPSTENS